METINKSGKVVDETPTRFDDIIDFKFEVNFLFETTFYRVKNIETNIKDTVIDTLRALITYETDNDTQDVYTCGLSEIINYIANSNDEKFINMVYSEIKALSINNFYFRSDDFAVLVNKVVSIKKEMEEI
jgi:hypothetical protein